MRFLPLLLALACTHDAPADLLITAETIRLGGTETTHALAIRDGYVIATGRDATELTALVTRDLPGSTVVPGLHDAHTHTLPGSFAVARPLLIAVSSMSTLQSMIASYAKAHPDEPWIVAYGWTSQLLGEPDGRLLDEVVPDRPVILISGTGHSAVVNTKALTLAGVTKATRVPGGGELVTDPTTGELTGLLRESAMGLVMPTAIAAYDDNAILPDLIATLEEMADAGLTSISEIMAVPGVSMSRPWLFARLADEGRLPLRVHVYLRASSAAQLHELAATPRDWERPLVRFAGVKVWIDGSLGAMQGWTRKPYQSTGTTGTVEVPVPELIAMLAAAEAHGFPLKLHAMGDGAVEAVCTALDEVADAQGGLSLTHTLDHAVLVDDAQRACLAVHGVVASMQPTHRLTAPLAGWADELEDWSLDDVYDLGAMIDAGVPVALGTDWPVWKNPSPLLTLATAIGDPRPNALDAVSALDAHTRGSAASVGMSGELGCLHPGCLADLVALSVDPHSAELSELKSATVDASWVHGEQIR